MLTEEICRNLLKYTRLTRNHLNKSKDEFKNSSNPTWLDEPCIKALEQLIDENVSVDQAVFDYMVSQKYIQKDKYAKGD